MSEGEGMELRCAETLGASPAAPSSHGAAHPTLPGHGLRPASLAPGPPAPRALAKAPGLNDALHLPRPAHNLSPPAAFPRLHHQPQSFLTAKVRPVFGFPFSDSPLKRLWPIPPPALSPAPVPRTYFAGRGKRHSPPYPPPYTRSPLNATRGGRTRRMMEEELEVGGGTKVINLPAGYQIPRPASASQPGAAEVPRSQLFTVKGGATVLTLPQHSPAPRLSSHFATLTSGALSSATYVAPRPAPHALASSFVASSAGLRTSGFAPPVQARPASASHAASLPSSLSSTYALSALAASGLSHSGAGPKILLAPSAVAVSQQQAAALINASHLHKAATPGPPPAGLLSPVPGTASAPPPVTTPGQSPRPSILRKRPSEAPPTTNAVAAPAGAATVTTALASPAVRKLVYAESSTSSTPNSGDGSGTRPETPLGRSSVTSEEASNHSSSSNDRPASSTPATTAASAELSPRKRPRKQQFEPSSSSKATSAKSQEKKESGGLGGKSSRTTMNGHVSGVSSASPLPTDSRPSSSQTDKTSETASTLLGEEEEDGLSDDDSDSREGSESPLLGSPSRRWRSGFPRWVANASPPPAQLASTAEQAPEASGDSSLETRKGRGEFRPRPSLLAEYEMDWAPRAHHHKRPEYVRARGSAASVSLKRRGDVLEEGGRAAQAALAKLAAAKDTPRRLSPWKLGLVEWQLLDLAASERESAGEAEALLRAPLLPGPGPDQPDAEAETLLEMGLTMAQRNKAVAEALDDARLALVAALPRHEDKVKALLRSYASKRPPRGKRQPKSY